MNATDSTGSPAPGNLQTAQSPASASVRLADPPTNALIDYNRGRPIPVERIPVAIGWATLVAGVYNLHEVWLVTRVLVPNDRTGMMQPTTLFDLPLLAEPASGFLLIPAGIALIRNHRWPYKLIAVWESIVLAMFSCFYVPILWTLFGGPRGIDAWQLLDRFSILSGAIYPAFAVVFFIRSPNSPANIRRRAQIALATAGLFAGISRIGEARFGKMGFYLLPRAFLSWDFSDGGDWLVQTGIAMAYLAIGVMTVSAAIRMLRRRVYAADQMRWTEWAYVLLAGFLLSHYFRTVHVATLFATWYRLNTVYSWIGSLHQIIYPTLGLLLFRAIIDDPPSNGSTSFNSPDLNRPTYVTT